MDNFNDYLFDSYEIREKLVADKFRPRYHFLPPEGRWNDLNGAIFWKGRYHLGYLQKITNGPNELDFSSWQHISSRDLLHWTYHKASLREPLEGKKGDYFNSGDAMEGMDVPTIITNMPRRGICIYQCHDDNLDDWVPLPENPVIPIEAGWNHLSKTLPANAKYPESVIFDPSGWKEGDTYYALIGNKNHRLGYEGDSTSLFKSKDLKEWAYVGPFYKSDRKWTSEEEDCACSDFFPFGQKHMLLMHTHRPISKCQYYIGRYENERFIPEINGQLSHLGSMLAGPETLIDDKGRRLFWGWIRDARDAEEVGWNSIMTLPWHFLPSSDNRLQIHPVDELKALRYDEKRVDDIHLLPKQEVRLDNLASDCMELQLTIEPVDAQQFGLKLLCSPDCEEETLITFDRQCNEFIIDFENASRDRSLVYPCGPETLKRGNLKQRIPYPLGKNQALTLDIFVDRSVLEIFVNGDICIVQRVYPMREDSQEVRLFTKDSAMTVCNIVKWQMDATNAW
ncbi:MAG: glycoside hydrolase family 32 protein [Chloroflexota bacterium]